MASAGATEHNNKIQDQKLDSCSTGGKGFYRNKICIINERKVVFNESRSDEVKGRSGKQLTLHLTFPARRGGSAERGGLGGCLQTESRPTPSGGPPPDTHRCVHQLHGGAAARQRRGLMRVIGLKDGVYKQNSGAPHQAEGYRKAEKY